jgi:hypothetical protein
MIESLDKQIESLDAILESVEEDWEKPIIQEDIIWFAKLVNKTKLLRDSLIRQRKVLKNE